MLLNEKIGDVLRSFHSSSCYPSAQDFEVEAAAEKVLAVIREHGYAIVPKEATAAREIKRLRAALSEISKGEGAFSRDPLTHATNTIESMKQIALDELEK